MSDDKERKNEGIPKEGKEAILTGGRSAIVMKMNDDHAVKIGSKLEEEEAVIFHQG